jgi:hypothetical protein
MQEPSTLKHLALRNEELTLVHDPHCQQHCSNRLADDLQLTRCCKMQSAKRLPTTSRKGFTQCVILFVCTVYAAYAQKKACAFHARQTGTYL